MVYPIDTDHALPGTISYISSGPLIGSDTSILIHREVTLEGNRAIVSLDEGQSLSESSQQCDTARKAVVVIHTKTLFNTLTGWLSTLA